MGAPRISVCGKTANSADRLAHWIGRVRAFADEVVLLVDDTSADDTLAVASAHADVVVEFEHSINNEACLDYGPRLASGDWLLWLDDDEFFGPGFPEAVAGLLATSRLTHYYLPYRWVVPDGRDGFGVIRTFPWHPDPRLRLVRNLPSLYHHRGRPHSPYEVWGEGRVLADDALAIWHLDFVWKDRAAREAKVAGYRRRIGPSCEEYYLWEDYQDRVDIEPFDPATVFDLPAEGWLLEPRKPPTPGSAGMPAGARPPKVSAADLARSVEGHWVSADIFSASYDRHTTPAVLRANGGATVEVTVTNTSPYRWRTTGEGSGRVELSYHWSHPEHGRILTRGDITVIPHTVEPGEQITVTAGLWSPFDAGTYILEWDLHAAGINWFSERGVPPLAVPVEVSPGDRALPRRHDAATVPPPRAATRPPLTTRIQAWVAAAARAARHVDDRTQLQAGNLVALPRAVRVLDTRNGTGVTGARTGPIEAGSAIDLDVTDYPDIPDHAVGVVLNVGILDANYGGYLTATAADGTTAVSTVDAYFHPGMPPSTTPVLAALGRDRYQGQVSLRFSPFAGGTLQLIVEASGYLV